MVTVNELIAYGQKLQTEIPAIGYNQTVIDDSQLVKDLSEISPEENHLLYLVIPSINNQGSDDALTANNEMMFLVLQKCDSSIAHEDFLQVIHNTQQTARAIEVQMLRDKEDSCGFMGWLESASIQIDPIWGIASCSGWSIRFSMKTLV